jgi:RNA polymerase sigma-70 factor (ECF subfamily)
VYVRTFSSASQGRPRQNIGEQDRGSPRCEAVLAASRIDTAVNREELERRGCRYGVSAAHSRDEDAFRALVETHRAALFAHCYRMLGSLQDAEDALQDTLFNAWRGLSGFDGRSGLRWWLYRVATNTCLDAIARRPKRVLPIARGPRDGAAREGLSADALWMELYPDQLLGPEDGYATEASYEQREAVELAFVMALQHLPPRQRAVLVLRDVLGFSAKEASRSLRTTVTSVNSALQRARKAVDERVTETSKQASVRSLGDASVYEIVQRFVDALHRGDVEAIVALLAEDAGLASGPTARRATAAQTVRTPRTVSFPRCRLPSELAA